MTEIAKIPTLNELIQEDEQTYKDNALMVILNQEPPRQWLKEHPIIKVKDKNGKLAPLLYLPVARVEYLLSRIYIRWWVEVRKVQVIANSVVVTIRLFVINPINKQEEWNDGVGSSPIQTDSGKGAMDWNSVKSGAVQMAAPAGESYALKDAAEKFGKLFGKDLSRPDDISYNELLKVQPMVNELKEMFEAKKHLISEHDRKRYAEIIEKEEQNSYVKLHLILKAL